MLIQKQTMGEKGNVVTNREIDDYNIEEVEDYGLNKKRSTLPICVCAKSPGSRPPNAPGVCCTC